MLNAMRNKTVMLMGVLLMAIGVMHVDLSKASQVLGFMLRGVTHELGLNDYGGVTIAKHAPFHSWHVSIGPYKGYNKISRAAKYFARLNYSVKVANNKNNSVYYLLVGDFTDYQEAQKIGKELVARSMTL